MIVRKNLSLGAIFEFTGNHLIWLTPWMFTVTALYHFTQWQFMTIPWLPLSLVGTSVAFYIGFKNNQSYDRIREARGIWGSIVNNSRKLSTMIKNYRSEGALADFADADRRLLIRRHIAYLYQLREQLLRPTAWEHVSLRWIFGSLNRARRERLFNKFKQELEEVARQSYLPKEELDSLEGFNNKATQLLDRQTSVIQSLYDRKAINWMQQSDLQNVLNAFYDDQGRAERIKNFPFPRQFASFSFVFTCIFVFLLPFGIVAEFDKLGPEFVWLTVPVGVVIGWIYVVMEMIGDYSENPFEGLYNDIPMLAICRTIEIDLLQMMGEKNVPKPLQPKEGSLL
ncbi:MAG: bestrophin family ion channel [Chryseolinea sp.]